MKKICFMLVAAVFTAACARETVRIEEPEEDLVEYVFSAGSDISKTTFNGSDFVWTSGDRISVFDSSLKNRRFETEDSGSKAIFRGRAKESTSFYAFYPYNSETKMTEPGVVIASIPSNQKVSPGVITDGNNPTMGKIESPDPSGIADASFLMKNVGGYVKIILGESSSPITYMSVTAVGGENLSGKVMVDGRGDVPVAVSDGGMPVVGLSSIDTTFRAGTYYAVAAPTKLSSGLKLTLVRSDDYSIEVPFACDGILRNSARNSTLSLPEPDKLGWQEPKVDTLHVAFVDPTTSNLKYYQPFDEELPAVSSPSTALAQDPYHLKDTGEEFFISTTRLQLNSGTGLRLEMNGYVTLPAIPGKRLSKVIVNYGYQSSSVAHFIRITPDEADAESVPGGEVQQLGPDAQGQDYSWTLTESVSNTKYRLVNDDLRSSGTFRIRSLDLIYIGRNVASIAEASISEAVLGEGEITVKGSLNVVHPEDGVITWGVEYREELDDEWTAGPTGTGTDISATITGIDNTRIWYVRVYGKADGGANVYSEPRRLRKAVPVTFTIDKFGGFNGSKDVAVEYDGTATGGHWKYTGDRSGYTYPVDKNNTRKGKVDPYDYYAEPTDIEPLIPGVKIYANATNAYFISTTKLMHYGGGYIILPGKAGHFISKVTITVSASAAGTAEKPKVITICQEDASSASDKVLGKSQNYSNAGKPEALEANVVAPDEKGVKAFISAAYNITKLEIAYTPL